MVNGRRKAAWDHTSWLLSLVAEHWRDPEQRIEPFTWRDFHPYETASAQEPSNNVIEADITVLKVFVQQ